MTLETSPRHGAPTESNPPATGIVRPYRPGRAMRWLLALARNIQIGSLTFVFPDGTRERMSGPEPGPDAVFEVHRDRIARRFIVGGTLGFCEAYLDGDWSSPDMETLFIVTLRNEDRLQQLLAGKGWYRALQFLSHAMRRNNRRGAKRNIAYHYDVGNSFYEKWLDPSMTYSSAVFAGAGTLCDLAAGQHRKYRALATRMDLAADHHVLEIGCGWGGFAEFAAREVGARVTGITISREQHDFARRRIFEAGLTERVDIRLQDYREVSGKFDRIASIEMFEAVGEAYWPRFFATLRERLVTGGAAALQIITIADRYFENYRQKADYIQKYIFPGGMLPSPSELSRQFHAAGLTLREMAGFGQDYAQTLRLWNDRFQAAWPEIQTLGFDARFKRMWEQYFHYCAAGFGVGTIDVFQLAVTRD